MPIDPRKVLSIQRKFDYLSCPIYLSPVRAVESLHEVGGRFANCERADDGSDCESPGGPEPGGDHLHCRRVDPGEEESS